MADLKESATTLLKRLGAAEILPVERETSLHIRLDDPFVSQGASPQPQAAFSVSVSNRQQGLFFLVPNNRPYKVHDLAVGVDLPPANKEMWPLVCLSEECSSAVHYLM